MTMVEAGPIFEHLHSEFFAALEACRIRPSQKAVHRLRTTTRRLEALLNMAKHRCRGNVKFGQKVDKALKALKPIRKAAGPVRDMDVQKGLLADLLKAKFLTISAAQSNIVLEEARKLQVKLKKYREASAAELISVITNAGEREVKWISPLYIALSGIKWTSVLKAGRAVERRSAENLHMADPESLHAYRKNSKSARYLAEMEQESPAAERFAKRMKEILDAIGGWHDWMLLTQLAKETPGKSSALIKVVKKQRDRALWRAVRAVEGFHRHA